MSSCSTKDFREEDKNNGTTEEHERETDRHTERERASHPLDTPALTSYWLLAHSMMAILQT